jgi:predicted transcriptional regulator of viral defense system
MDRLEKYIKMTVGSARNRRLVGKAAVNQKEPKGRVTMSASDTVLDIVKRYNKGIGFAEIQAKTGFEEKKLRNIIFRLNKMGKISRKSRGIYIVD